MKRRRFVGYLLRAGLFLPVSFFSKARVYAATQAPPAVPLKDLADPWAFVEFEFTKPIKTHRGLRSSTFPGYLIKLPDAIGKRLALKDNFYAVSRICPHEGCPINFYRQRQDVPYPLSPEEFPHPMLVCTCHQSIFDPALNGKVIAGPAPRPPWTFDFVIEKGSVIIKDLEPGGEKWG